MGIYRFGMSRLDDHGTIEAAIRVLRRHFWWEKATEIDGSPVWRLRVRRYGDVGFELFLIAHWVDWNAAGVRWDEGNYLAQNCEMALGKMEFKTFVRRCTRLWLKYPRYGKVKCKRGTNCGLNLFH